MTHRALVRVLSSFVVLAALHLIVGEAPPGQAKPPAKEEERAAFIQEKQEHIKESLEVKKFKEKVAKKVVENVKKEAMATVAKIKVVPKTENHRPAHLTKERIKKRIAITGEPSVPEKMRAKLHDAAQRAETLREIGMGQPRTRPVFQAVKKAYTEKQEANKEIEEDDDELIDGELIAEIAERTEEIEETQQEILQKVEEILAITRGESQTGISSTEASKPKRQPEEERKEYWTILSDIKEKLQPILARLDESTEPLPGEEAARYEETLNAIKATLRPVEWRIKEKPTLLTAGNGRESFLEELQEIKEQIRDATLELRG